MELRASDAEIRQAVKEMLGYLNLSSGAADARFQRHLNQLCAWVRSQESGGRSQGPGVRGQGTCTAIAGLLRQELAALRGSSAAFADVSQADAVIELALDKTLAAYRAFHRDLLFHRADGELFRPLFLARVFEAVLQEGGPWDEADRIVRGAVQRLNHFIGHRPVAVLENERRMEPYLHEWVRPIPLYIREAGIEIGPYQPLLAATLEILRTTPGELLELAYFDPELLDELAVDPRAYDFDHPANKRVNYVFGQWDPHHIDSQGRYRRYVATSVTFEALWHRVENEKDIPYDERLYEGAAVLAGTMLMGSGVSGRGPDTHDSSVSLASLLPRIAGLRDAFYDHLMSKVSGAHADRLRKEAEKRKQPFAGARQHLNQRLAYLRALQQQHVLLADIYARMGFPDAARRQIADVPAASARMSCEIHCHITSAHLAIDRGDLTGASRLLREIDDLLRRAINCGAIVDPWNILGFAGQFSLFPAAENSVHDHRIDLLIRIMEAIFAVHARLASEAAAVGHEQLGRSVTTDMRKLADWWDQFASTEVSDVGGFSGREAADSAEHVAHSLGAWQQAGGEAGDLAFWRKHVASFNSPRAYAQVIAALLEKGDHAAAMALLMQWLSQVENVPLETVEHSFQRLALRWMNTVRLSPSYAPQQRWSMIRRFFDYLAANADDYWQPPHFAFARSEGDKESSAEDTFAAAYEGVTYQDSTADGFEGDVFETGSQPTEFELDQEAQRLHRRLAFLGVLAELWEVAALTLEADGRMALQGRPDGPGSPSRAEGLDDPSCPAESTTALTAWYAQAEANWRGLTRLLDELHGYHVPEPSPSHDALVEYDRRLGVKELLLENVMATMVVTSVAARTLLAISNAPPHRSPAKGEQSASELPAWEQHAVDLRREISRRNLKAARKHILKLLRALRKEALLYVPLSRGGKPQAIVRARTLQALIAELLQSLPRMGLWAPTCELLEAAWEMESRHRVGDGAVSEFDRLFTTGFQSLVEALVHSVNDWAGDAGGGRESLSRGRGAAGETIASREKKTPEPVRREEHFDSELIDFLNELTEKLLKLWLRHSTTLRLSILEGLDGDEWRQMVQFIKTYGHDLFTPQFLNEGNLRAVFHQGASVFLSKLKERPDPDYTIRLVDDLDREIPLAEAAEQLERVIQAIIENEEEYNDYNHTTTQSDRGEMLYCLLDFLRLKTSYERTAWKLTPVVLAHEVLVRQNRTASAELWRRGIAEQTAAVAAQHLERYQQLAEKYGMRLPTVADRLQERFVRPLEVDRLRAFIRPALEELHAGRETRTFDRLEQEINEFAAAPSGVGLDIPPWLAALDEEVHNVKVLEQPELSHRSHDHLGWIKLTPQQVKRELDRWDVAP